MNPIVVGALIGAVPAVIAAALATWADVRTAGVSLAQTQLTLAAEHGRWLRDKGGDQYVEMIRFLDHAEVHRRDVTKEGKVTEGLNQEAQKMIGSYQTSEMADLLARARVYASPEVYAAFSLALTADLTAWEEIFLSAVQSAESGSEGVVATDDLKSAVALANDRTYHAVTMIRRDLHGQPTDAGRSVGHERHRWLRR